MPPIIIDDAAIQRFNALPRPQRTASGGPKNHWHFDLRYIYLHPPSHLFFLVQPDSRYIHSEGLPLNKKAGFSGIVFFPEFSTAAASEVCKALIHSFLDGFGEYGIKHTPPKLYAPWSLSTEDASLARAVEREFRRLGVRSELCQIRTMSHRQANSDEAFNNLWDTLTLASGFSGNDRKALAPPHAINFSNMQSEAWTNVPPSQNLKIMQYAQEFYNSGLVTSQTDLAQNMRDANQLIGSKSSRQVEMDADEGNADSALEYALR
jgi:hypothetical protein